MKKRHNNAHTHTHTHTHTAGFILGILACNRSSMYIHPPPHIPVQSSFTHIHLHSYIQCLSHSHRRADVFLLHIVIVFKNGSINLRVLVKTVRATGHFYKGKKKKEAQKFSRKFYSMFGLVMLYGISAPVAYSMPDHTHTYTHTHTHTHTHIYIYIYIICKRIVCW